MFWKNEFLEYFLLRVPPNGAAIAALQAVRFDVVWFSRSGKKRKKRSGTDEQKWTRLQAQVSGSQVRRLMCGNLLYFEIWGWTNKQRTNIPGARSRLNRSRLVLWVLVLRHFRDLQNFCTFKTAIDNRIQSFRENKFTRLVKTLPILINSD